MDFKKEHSSPLTNEERKVRITRLLDLIDGVNQSIASSKLMESQSMIRQYEHLKMKYTKELIELLSGYELPINWAEAA